MPSKDYRNRTRAEASAERDLLLVKLQQLDSQNRTVIVMLANLNTAIESLRAHLDSRFNALGKQQRQVAEAILAPPATPSVPKPFFKVDQ